MIFPKKITKESAKKYIEDIGKDFTMICVSGSGVHENPKFYKYYWWIYSMESQEDSAAEVFYKKEYRLSLKEFNDEAKRLESNKISFAYVNSKVHRLGSILNYNKLKEKYPDIEFAPSFEDDTDEIFKGHK